MDDPKESRFLMDRLIVPEESCGQAFPPRPACRRKPPAVAERSSGSVFRLSPFLAGHVGMKLASLDTARPGGTLLVVSADLSV
jgi:hypothetical protein